MERESLRPISSTRRLGRQRLSMRHELTLAFLPPLAVLLVLFLVESFSHQRLLFASLASSALEMTEERGAEEKEKASTRGKVN